MNNQEYVIIIFYLSECGIWRILTFIGSTVVPFVSTRRPRGLPAATEVVTTVVAVTTAVEVKEITLADTVRFILLCWKILVH